MSIVLIILEKHILSCESNSRYFQLYMMTFRTRGLSVVPRGLLHMCLKWFRISQCIPECFSCLLRETKQLVYGDTSGEILASWANMSKRKGILSPGPEDFFRIWSNRTSFYFSFPEVRTGAGMGICTDVVCCCVSSVICSYCFKYDFPDQVPIGWGTSACVVQACLSLSESLREAVVTLPSSGRTEITLQDFPFDLDFFESHCLSWARSGCIHMISPFFSVKGTRP